MTLVSPIAVENTRNKKSPKIHRARADISKKVVAFHELVNLQNNKQSARQASNLLEVPNSTMQSWKKQRAHQGTPTELIEFFDTPVGADFLQRNIMAVMKLMKCGPSGIRGMQEYLCNSGLDEFVAPSEGALQKFWVRFEDHVIEFGEKEEKR